VPSHPVFPFWWPPITTDGKISRNAINAVRPCSVRNVRMVRHILEVDPTISTRLLTAHTGTPPMLMYTIHYKNSSCITITFSLRQLVTQNTLAFYQQRRICASLGLGSATFTTNMCAQMKILMRLEHIQQWQISVKQWVAILLDCPILLARARNSDYLHFLRTHVNGLL
jgi:hypothetical protein